MSRVVFDIARPVVESDPARMDIACFVGLARATGAALGDDIQQWLRNHGWADSPSGRSIDFPFTDIPIPIDSYATYSSLFDPGGSAESFGTDYLSAAVRSFFAQGGRRCYVVRMDDPLSPEDSESVNGVTGKLRKLAALLPGSAYAADDRRSWHGVGHLGGLPDVTFLAVPDLPVLSASDPAPAPGTVPETPSGPPRFVECTAPPAKLNARRLFLRPAPRLTPEDYDKRWSPGVQAILGYVARNAREVQFVAALPIPLDEDPGVAAGVTTSGAPVQNIRDLAARLLPEIVSDPDGLPGLSTTFLQLSYPWLRTTGSRVLNESLEPPDGALVGLLARNALTRGAFTSAVKIVPSEISDVSPALPDEETLVPEDPLVWDNHSPKPLIVRLSLFGFTPAGLRLLSDVTTYPGETYRPARVHRLVSVISRSARQLGERMVFEQNGPALWNKVEISLARLMTQLWKANALDGATVQEAFQVRCDTSTMTQNDLDNGRLIAEIVFKAASTIELIRVTLALETSGASAQGIAVLAEAS